MLLIIPFYSFTCSWACPLQWGKPSSNGCPSIWACRGPRRAVSALGGPLNNLFKAWRVPSAIKAFAGQKGLPPLWICLEPQKMSNLKTMNSNQRAISGWMSKESQWMYDLATWIRLKIEQIPVLVALLIQVQGPIWPGLKPDWTKLCVGRTVETVSRHLHMSALVVTILIHLGPQSLVISPRGRELEFWIRKKSFCVTNENMK